MFCEHVCGRYVRHAVCRQDVRRGLVLAYAVTGNDILGTAVIF